jgi:hypothetical protein
MKTKLSNITIVLTITSILLLTGCSRSRAPEDKPVSGDALFASDDSLPFPVSLGGQAAKDGTPFAKIENPVAADAELAVESKSDMIIVNVNMVTAKNEPVQGSEPAVILLEGKTKTNIDKTMDGKKLPAGNYIMSVVSEGKTANILFTIK